jgi:hypothetical protein
MNRSTPASRGLGHGPGADHVVAHPLDGVQLHHRHMLVGGGMEHHVDLLGAHQHVDERRLRDRAEYGNDLDLGGQIPQLALDLKERVLAMIEQHKRFRRAGHKLAAQLRADGAACPGHKDAPPGIGAGDTGQFVFQRVAAQKRGRVDGLAFVRRGGAAGDQVREGGQRMNLAAGRGQAAAEPHARGLRGAWHGQDDARDAVLRDQRVDGIGAMDAQTGDDQPAQVLLVIDKGHDAHAVIGPERRGKLLPGLARAIDQHRQAGRIRA